MDTQGLLRQGFIVAALAAAVSVASAQNIHITIPRHSELTPVQKLNREGVDEVLKRKYERAETLFYKAYLYDPSDPFTLNNLGYVSELQGQVEKASTYYKLAVEQGCYAVIDRSSEKSLKGKPMMDALGTLKNMPMRVNRINIYGIQLLSQNRGFEAEAVLKQLLAADPNNPFTLNNLAVAEESTGNLDDALKYYDAAAGTRSMQPVVVTLKKSSRGKPISEVAAGSASELRKRMEKMDPREIRAYMLTIRGLSAISQNDWDRARKEFLDAYEVDPQSAFTLNNIGYVAERDGDLETAMSYYARAQRASDADGRIGMASKPYAQGQKLAAVAFESHRNVDVALDAQSQIRHPQPGPAELLRRDDNPAPPTISPTSSTPSVGTPAPSAP